MPGLTEDQMKAFCAVDRILRDAGYMVMMAGGAVRDHLLGIPPEDLDFATTATPEQAMKAFRDKGCKVIPTGIKHGTITVIVHGQQVEVTTLRVDKKTDGRHAEVEWTTDFRLDASRRDLTINSMFMQFPDKVHDYFGGQNDLKHLMICFVGKDVDRIREDYLRIMRYFRFFARYEGSSVDPSTMHAIAQHGVGLRKISGERIWSELCKIFVGPNRLQAAHFMHNNYVFDNISPHLKYDHNTEHKMRMLNGNPRARSPLYFIASMVKSTWELGMLRERLKFDNNSFDILDHLIKRRGLTTTVPNVRDRLATGSRVDLLYHEAVYEWNTPVCEFLDDYRKNPTPKFPVTGHDVMALGYQGKQIGEAITLLKESWAQSAYKATKEELLELISVG